jgi:hypothetical protein
MGSAVSLVLERDRAMVSRVGRIAESTPIQGFVAGSGMPADGLAGPYCIVAGVGAVADDAVGQGTDSSRASRDIAVVTMRRVEDRMNQAASLACRDAYLAMALLESATMKHLILDYGNVDVLEPVVGHNSSALRIQLGSIQYADEAIVCPVHNHWQLH